MKNDFKKLFDAYNYCTEGALKYFNPNSMDDSILTFIFFLQYLRDYKILACPTEPEQDPKIASLHEALTEFAKYWVKKQELCKGYSMSNDDLVALNTEKDVHLRNFWEILSHNCESWFE